MTETKYYEQTGKIEPDPSVAVINGKPETTPDLFGAVAGRQCLYVGCRINIDHKKADAKYCCDDHRIRQYYVNEAHDEALHDLEYQNNASNKFEIFISRNPSFINQLTFEIKKLFDDYGVIPFRIPFDLMRTNKYRYHIPDYFRIPCKAFLKEHHPELCKMIKDFAKTCTGATICEASRS